MKKPLQLINYTKPIVAIILFVFGLLVKPFDKRINFKKQFVYPLSILIALIASYWTIERVMMLLNSR